MAAIMMAACSREQSTVESQYQPSLASGQHDLVAEYCSGCHAPPHAQSHAPAEWPAIVARMQEHRDRNGMPPVPDDALAAIVAALQHAAHNS